MTVNQKSPSQGFSTSNAIPTEKELNEFLAGAAVAPYLACDTEANGADIRDGRGFAVGVSLAYRLPGIGVLSDYFPFRHIDGGCDQGTLVKLKKSIESHPCAIFHNAKFDLVSLKTLGIDYTGKFYDTMLMAQLLDENLISKELDSLTRLYLNDPGKKRSATFKGFLDLYGWAEIPSYLMHDYAAYDPDLTLRLFEYLLPRFQAEGLDEEVWEYKQGMIRAVARMEKNGIKIDQDLSQQELLKGQQIMDRISQELGLNPGSPNQLKKLLIDELGLPVVKWTKPTKASKNPEAHVPKASFDKYAMEQYETMLDKLGDKRASKILEYRGWQKTCSSNYKAYLELISPDGRVRPNYLMHRTLTGRLSCEKPNLQQIPRVSEKAWNGALKSAFIPEDGWGLWEADYGQLELRLATAYAKVEPLLRAFSEGRDVFSEMASTLGMSRYDTKQLTYTIQYGGGINRISEIYGVTHSQAEKIRANFFEMYPGFEVLSQQAKTKCRLQGYLRLWSGRRRHFADRKADAHKAFNSAIQGGAADIFERTIVKLDRENFDPNECRMLLQVHDSVVFEIKEGLEEQYHKRIHEIMTNIEPDFGVVFAVDIKKWGEE